MGGSLDGYDLSAKVPAGATKEQLQLMVQNLLVERFHLAVHRETRNGNQYTLLAGKGKPKQNAPRGEAAQGQALHDEIPWRAHPFRNRPPINETIRGLASRAKPNL
jgi:uncharacterized protein (TIGR03435 family)